MGCSPSMTWSQKSGSASVTVTSQRDGNATDKIWFTENEKTLVRRTWKLLANDMTGRGSAIFLRIFHQNPEMKQLFPFSDIEGDELLRNVQFKGHASRFMQAVGAAVDHIDDLDGGLSPLLDGLGRQHVLFTGFKAEYFSTFKEAILFTWQQDLKRRFTDEAQAAWNKVFDFIIVKLQDGYNNEKEQRDI